MKVFDKIGEWLCFKNYGWKWVWFKYQIQFYFMRNKRIDGFPIRLSKEESWDL